MEGTKIQKASLKAHKILKFNSLSFVGVFSLAIGKGIPVLQGEIWQDLNVQKVVMIKLEYACRT